MQGRRLPDTAFGELPDDVQPGDYWKVLNRETGEPMVAKDAPQNLTGMVWHICAPNGAIGLLMKHTVREEDDGTISVRAGDGSSNSILIQQRHKDTVDEWHGYIEHGVWSSV